MLDLPTPHLEKLNAALQNEKLPESDKPRIEAAIERYRQWVIDLQGINKETVSQTVERMTQLLNEYRNYLDVEVIFDSEDNFLYRQKGQTKLDNSVIEEFLPHLIMKCVLEGKLDDESFQLGPMKTFSAIYFTSGLNLPYVGGGLHVRTKDQDFTISRRIYLKTSYTSDFSESDTKDFCIAYVAAECKTNLDKTMFQEASATAHDVKSAVQGAKCYLLCEWLDMTPQSTSTTAIDEVLILRKAKRMPSGVRSEFGTAEGRKQNRQVYVDFLNKSPFSADIFERFVGLVSRAVSAEDPIEDDVLRNGYF